MKKSHDARVEQMYQDLKRVTPARFEMQINPPPRPSSWPALALLIVVFLLLVITALILGFMMFL